MAADAPANGLESVTAANGIAADSKPILESLAESVRSALSGSPPTISGANFAVNGSNGIHAHSTNGEIKASGTTNGINGTHVTNGANGVHSANGINGTTNGVNGTHVTNGINGTSNGVNGTSPLLSNGVNVIPAVSAPADSKEYKLPPVAIVGFACRTAGDVSNPEQLWEMCSRARTGWGSVPADRWNHDAFYHPHNSKKGSTNAQGGYFMKHDLAAFDAPFFNITEQDALAMDPQQRILLECVFEAMEAAGVTKESLVGSDTGVFVGNSASDYDSINYRDVDSSPQYCATGTPVCMQSNRISYLFDLRGPSFTADTACSSSMTALHQAMLSIRTGESRMAIVAGSHLNLTPDYFIHMASSQLMGDTGKTFAFDHRAIGGFGRGEGVGVVILKALDTATKDNDIVRSVLVNTGINQDGKTNGITVPNGAAQEALIRKVYTDAGINPAETGYVEMHGTGTKVGDPIEATAVRNVLGVGRTPRAPLYIGSLKTQIGHLEGASGIMSIIKSSLILEKGLILPNSNFEKANPNIPLDQWNIKVPTSVRPWPRGKRFISVSNYGFGGGNAHAVLERAPQSSKITVSDKTTLRDPKWRLYTFSANDADSLKERMRGLTFYLEQRPEVFEKTLSRNLSYTLNNRRSHLTYKMAIAATSTDDLGIRLASSKAPPVRSTAEPRIGFVFTGQGAQWAKMGMDLIEDYPIFAKAIEDADACLLKLGADFSLTEELRKENKISKVNLAHVSQPACTAVQIGLTKLLNAWGILPVSVTGHSSGSIGAAFAAGIIDLESAMALAYFRGKATTSLKKRFPELRGSMLAVGAGAETIRPLIAKLKTGYATVACLNSPASITVSGDESAIDELQPMIQELSIFNRKLKVDQAYHSEHMARVADEYLESIKDIQPQESSGAVYYSSLHGRIADPHELVPAYWVANLTSPVQFTDSVKEMCMATDGPLPNVNTLVEVGPHAALAGPVKDILKTMGDQGKRIAYTGCPIAREKIGPEIALQLAGALYMKGCKVNFSAINFPITETRPPILLTDLPLYNWNHSKKYWAESRMNKAYMFPKFVRNDIIGKLAMYSNELEPTWRNILRLDDMPWLRHHKMQGMVVYPMSGYIAQAVEAASQRAIMRDVSFDSFEIREVVINRALVLEEQAEVETTISLRPFTEGTRAYSTVWDEFRICSYEAKRGWLEHCRGLVAVRKSDISNPVDGSAQVDNARAELTSQIETITKAATDPVNVSEMFDTLLSHGIEYGATFQGCKNSMGCDQHAWAEVTSTDTKGTMPFAYEPDVIIHPALGDIIIQTLWPIFGAGRGGMKTYYMPSAVDHLTLSRNLPEVLKSYATARGSLDVPKPTKFNIFATAVGDATEKLISYEGITMTPIKEMDMSGGNVRELCYKLEWQSLKEAYPEETLTNGHPPETPSIPETPSVNGISGAAVRPDPFAEMHQKELGLGEDVVVVYVTKKQEAAAPIVVESLHALTGKAPTSSSLADVDATGKLMVLLELDEPILADIEEKTFYHLQKALLAAAGTVWAVSGAYQNSTSPTSNMAVGFARSVRSETLAKIAMIDLDPASLKEPKAAAGFISDVFKATFITPTNADSLEMEFSERKGELFVPRVLNDNDMNTFIQRETLDAEPHEQPFAQEGRRLKLAIGTAGALDTLHFVDEIVDPLPADEIEIKVEATGMNFKDVVVAMGQVQQPYIGVESSGVVASIGSGVTDLQVGQRVMAMTEGAYSTFARCKSSSAHAITDAMTFAEAATVPVIFCTAYYGLITLAQLEAGETVLIHAAAGGVGQAAIMLAKMVGAEIFATCGSPDKKKFLMETYGLPEDHIFYSRDVSFGVPVRRATKGKGVDVVLNSLAGDVLRETWDCLAHFGRFIEIGKRDITGNTRLEMARFEHNAMFASVDLTVVAAERPKLMKKLITNVCKLMADGTIKPIQPVTVYKISEVESAIRVLQSGKNTGKLVVVAGEGDMVKATAVRSRSDMINSEGSYIIVGGTGGLGRSMARWMSTKGARHIVLISRSGAANDKVHQLIDDMATEGTKVYVFPCDVAEKDSVERLIKEKMKDLPKVRGVIHAAMVLRDVLFEQMKYDQFTDVVKSKVTGAWNLHEVLKDTTLDFFIALSSVAGIVGNRGQAAYAAANVFLDAFVQYRNNLGLPATSIDLTAVSDVGYLAENASRQAQVTQNLGSETLQETEVLALIAAAIGGQTKKFCNNHCITGLKIAPAALHSLFFINDARFSTLRQAAAKELEGLSGGADGASVPLPQRIKTAPDHETAVSVLCEGLTAKLASVLMIPVEEMSNELPITAFGLDSLAAIEVRNWIAREVEANLQVLEILTSSSLVALSGAILKKSKLMDKKKEATKEEE